MARNMQNNALGDACVFGDLNMYRRNMNTVDSDEHESIEKPLTNKLADVIASNNYLSNHYKEVHSDSDFEMDYLESKQRLSDNEHQKDQTLHDYSVSAKDLLHYQDEGDSNKNKIEQCSNYDDLHKDALNTIKVFQKESIDRWVDGFQTRDTDFKDDMTEFAINIRDVFTLNNDK